MSFLLYFSIIIHLYKSCLFFCYLPFYSQWTRWWRFCSVWAPQASQRCFLWGIQNLWVIYGFLLLRFSLTLLLLLLLLLYTMQRYSCSSLEEYYYCYYYYYCSCNMPSSLGEYHHHLQHYYYYCYCHDEPHDAFWSSLFKYFLIKTCFGWNIIHCQWYNEK